jgi:hypothetical protein
LARIAGRTPEEVADRSTTKTPTINLLNSEDGGCPASGGANYSSNVGSSRMDSASAAGDTSCPNNSILDDDGEKDKKSGNWLVALAKAMGDIAGKHLERMLEAQDKMEAATLDDKDLEGLSDEEKSEKQQEAGKATTNNYQDTHPKFAKKSQSINLSRHQGELSCPSQGKPRFHLKPPLIITAYPAACAARFS